MPQIYQGSEFFCISLNKSWINPRLNRVLKQAHLHKHATYTTRPPMPPMLADQPLKHVIPATFASMSRIPTIQRHQPRYLHQHKQQTISQTHNKECSVQEVIYYISLELYLRRAFPGVQFVNTNLPKERSKILRTKDQLSSLPNDCADIFNKTASISTLQDHQPHFLVENVVCHLISLALQNLVHIKSDTKIYWN